MMVKQYKVTDTENGTVKWFDWCDAYFIKYAFCLDEDAETERVADKLIEALKRGKSTYGLEQFLGLKIEEEWVCDEY